MRIDKQGIRKLIPHGGNMCLLDEVLTWTQKGIECSTRTHLDKANPLRFNDQLQSLSLIEYGAQAMAIHGGLLAREYNRNYKPGYLAAIRQARFPIDNLENVSGEIRIVAEAQVQLDNGVVYNFTVSSEDLGLLAEGRATVIHLGEEHIK